MVKFGACAFIDNIFVYLDDLGHFNASRSKRPEPSQRGRSQRVEGEFPRIQAQSGSLRTPESRRDAVKTKRKIGNCHQFRVISRRREWRKAP